MPPERIELSTPGLQDQCSASELRRRCMKSIKLKYASSNGINICFTALFQFLFRKSENQVSL